MRGILADTRLAWCPDQSCSSDTAAYSANIFHGALQSISVGDLEAVDAYGMNQRQKFWWVIWSMLRLAWPSYTNEAIFMFHATTLCFSLASRRGGNRVTRSITPVILPTRRSTLSFPIRLWRAISFC